MLGCPDEKTRVYKLIYYDERVQKQEAMIRAYLKNREQVFEDANFFKNKKIENTKDEK